MDAIIVIDDNGETEAAKENRKLVLKVQKKPHTHKRQALQRKVQLNIYEDNMETLIITQKVLVKKPKTKCSMNHTNICKLNEKRTSIKKPDLNITSEERFLPYCLRRNCDNNMERCRQLQLTQKIERTRKEDLPYNQSMDSSLSPISSKQDDYLSYDDISSDSFKTNLDLQALLAKNGQTNCNTFDIQEPSVEIEPPSMDDDVICINQEIDVVSIHSIDTAETLDLDPLELSVPFSES